MKPVVLCLGLFVAALCNLEADEPDKWQQAINLAERLHEERKFTEARAILLGAVEVASKYQGRDYRLAYTFNNVGSVAQDQARYLEAEKYYRRSIILWRAAGPPFQVGLGRTLNNLASLLYSVGKFGEAQEVLRRSEALQTETMAVDDPETGIVFLNRGVIHLRLHKYREAEVDYRQAWAILQTHRERQLDLAQVAHGLGLICERTGRREEAISHYAFAQPIWEKEVESGRVTPEICMNLAALYSFQQQHLRAESILQTSLLLAERELGPEHPRLAAMLVQYATVLRQTGKKGAAARVEKQAQAIRARSEERLARHTVAISDLASVERSN